MVCVWVYMLLCGYVYVQMCVNVCVFVELEMGWKLGLEIRS